MMKKLSPSELAELAQALNFQKMDELKWSCEQLQVSARGKKGEIIERIIHFAKTGSRQAPNTLPNTVTADPNKSYPIGINEPILAGAYKNNTQTRLFFKNEVGPHFHFTAFGQEWIRQQWQKGTAPTYGQFAAFWQTEYSARKHAEKKPRAEWAYLNFMQKYQKEHQTSSRKEMAATWKEAQRSYSERAKELIIKLAK